jgi:hypothetical protein
MLMKAGLIVAIFMHMAWERLSLVYAILVPMSAVLVFVAIMMLEADYTLLSRWCSSDPVLEQHGGGPMYGPPPDSLRDFGYLTGWASSGCGGSTTRR